MHTRGFTLLEMLVAVAIFAVLAVMAYSGLSSVLKSREQLEQYSTRFNAVQQTVSIMVRDLQQTVQRPVRDAYGDPLAAFLARSNTDVLLEFTRDGWRNPSYLPRSHLQRVAYGVRDKELLRSTWRVLDRAQDSAPQVAVLLDRVDAIELRFMDRKGEWHPQWPPANENSKPAFAPIPRAVEFVLTLTDLGRINRLIRTTVRAP